MRYVLLFSDGSIHVGANDAEGKYFVWGKKGWRAAVGELTDLVNSRPREGKITDLEIQSHGLPGKIIVRENEYITHENVEAFGAMLKPIMAHGGLIEILACQVAACGRFAFAGKGFNTYPPEVIEEYFGGIEKDPVALQKQPDGKYKVVRLSGDKLAAVKKMLLHQRVQAMSPEDNGLQFCLTLARSSGCTVRASRMIQVEEIGDIWNGDPINPIYTPTHIIMRDYDRFGDWEGPVWDFMPNGQVKYLGCNLPRARLRFPTQPVGPQLTYNFREQGGNDSDVGQRPQRMNRSPMPV
jgi:hypothetical protein